MTTDDVLPCCGGTPPAFHVDNCKVVRLQTDRNGFRYVSRRGDRRERATSCVRCHTPTWALDLLCDRCAVDIAVDTYNHPESVA